MLTPLIAVLVTCGHMPAAHDLDSVELFSGVQSISNGIRGRGGKAAAFDKEYDPNMDLTSPLGFLLALGLCLRLKPGSETHDIPGPPGRKTRPGFYQKVVWPPNGPSDGSPREFGTAE